MKNYLQTVVAGVCVLLAPVLSHAANWQEFARSTDGEISSTDSASIVRKNADTISAWRMVNLTGGPKVQNDKPYESFLVLELHNCKERTTSIVEVDFYENKNQQGTQTSYQPPEKFRNAIPGTIGEINMLSACVAIEVREYINSPQGQRQLASSSNAHVSRPQVWKHDPILEAMLTKSNVLAGPSPSEVLLAQLEIAGGKIRAAHEENGNLWDNPRALADLLIRSLPFMAVALAILYPFYKRSKKKKEESDAKARGEC